MTKTLSISTLPSSMSDVKRAAELLIAAGCNKQATDYTFTASEFDATGLSRGALDLLLTTGLPHVPGGKGIVSKYANSRADGAIGVTLNYDLVP